MDPMTQLCAAAIAAATAHAGPETWTFTESTSGEDIDWLSPTAVSPDATLYHGEYQLTEVIATVLILGFPTPTDVTDLIPPDQLMGEGDSDGPAPVTLIDQSFEYPEPPDPPAVAADLFVGLDADGFGVLTATNVVLGSIDLGFPFGVVDIVGLEISGQITVTPADVGDPADINGDGAVNVLDLVQVITGWGACPPGDCPADVDGDGVVGVLDLIAVITAWG